MTTDKKNVYCNFVQKCTAFIQVQVVFVHKSHPSRKPVKTVQSFSQLSLKKASRENQYLHLHHLSLQTCVERKEVPGMAIGPNGVASFKFFGENTLNLSEQQYFVCETTSQGTERNEILEIFGGMAPLAPCLRLWLDPKNMAWYLMCHPKFFDVR